MPRKKVNIEIIVFKEVEQMAPLLRWWSVKIIVKEGKYSKFTHDDVKDSKPPNIPW